MSPVALSPPQIFVRPRVADGTIQFWWQPPLSTGGPFGIAAYTLSDGSNTFSLGPTNRTFIVTGLTNGTPYTFTITAQNTNGDTSDPATFRTVEPGLQPGPPSAPVAVVRSATSALVSWTPAVSDGGSAIGWYVVESESTGNPVRKVSALSTDTSQTVEDLTTGETYTFKVYTVNDVKYSAPAISAAITLNIITQPDLLIWLDGPTYAGSGTWYDKTDNHYDAIIETGTALKNDDGNAIVLNGSTGWRLPGSSANGIGSYPNWTISAWFKRQGLSVGPTCIFTEFYTGGTINMSLGRINGSETQLEGGFYSGGWQNGTPITFPLNEWHQIVVTWDGTNVKTYFDNSLSSTVNHAGLIAQTSSNNYKRIGQRWDNSDFIQGELGELLVYGRALTAEEISHNYGITQPSFINPPVVTAVTLDALTSASTNLASSWTLNFGPAAVTVKYYSTNSTTVPASGPRTQFGTTQTVASGTTTNTLDPAVQPDANTYYYAGVTVGAQDEVFTAVATLMPVVNYALGSTQFTYYEDNYTGANRLYPQKLIMSPGVTFGASDFTIDFWVYPTARGNFDDPDGNGSEGNGILGCSGLIGMAVFFYHWSGLQLQNEGGGSIGWNVNDGNPITLNTWHHIAITRVYDSGEDATYASAWLDGAQLGDSGGSIIDNGTFYATNPTTYVGYHAANRTYDLSGNLSDVRIVIGTALYDRTQSSITVPTAPLENVTGTQVLLHMTTSETWLTDTAGVQTVTADSDGSVPNPVWSATAPF
jgi:Concanavalin A-like lectin/glucanases superfamily/Fibronectin type III domain